MTKSSIPHNAERLPVQIAGLRGGAAAWFAAGLAGSRPCCCVLPDEQQVQDLEQDLTLFAPGPVITFPGYEIPPYTPLSPDQRTTAARLSALYRIAENREPFLLVVSMEALLRRVISRKTLLATAELLLAGEDFDLDRLRLHLANLGYDQVALVKTIGDCCIRGGILDVFPPPFQLPDGRLHEGPLRLDFFGDTIESIRAFDPITQRSGHPLEEAVLLPVSDILLPPADRIMLREFKRRFLARGEELDWDAAKTAEIIERVQHGLRFPGVEFFLPLLGEDPENPSSTVLDYLPENCLLVLQEPAAIERQLELVGERIQANYQTAAETGTPALPPEELFLNRAQLDPALAGFANYHLTDFSAEYQDRTDYRSSSHQLLKQEISRRRKLEGLLTPLVQQLTEWLEENDRVVLCCRSERRRQTLTELLERFQLPLEQLEPPLPLTGLTETTGPQPLYLAGSPLSHGFSLPEHKLHLLSETELFGEMRLGSRKKARGDGQQPLNYTELNDGDVVVHREHGLGLYRGLVTIALHGITGDFMLIEYRDGDRLYLPVDRLNLVSRYQGLTDRPPQLDKLGSQSWKNVKQKVSEEVWKVAHELLEVYATRQLRRGQAFSRPSELYHELEESFPFDETPGQLNAINETLSDLTSGRPMDRLVCGDVGYGKTEVAVRAAFKVIEDGCQAALLVPTTVLAEQHTKTFRERLRGFPVRVECLNRFKSPASQKAVVKDLASGAIDLVIGTHRLLSRDVTFKQLGLLIVDEEHRFGVAHKEKIKRFKAEVDILTLTATPIPRTLQMSLLGIRDLSVIASPPEHRKPVKTFVARYDDLVIKEAVNRELLRGGQVFVVHNRVKSIHRMAATIQKLVPEARVAVAHGQMAGKELEQIMIAFVAQEIDVLVSTTIIESGLDIPAANTIIINRADRLGLAEIYQLRGRVGRSAAQSFAYLLVPSLDHLSKESRERLRALMEYSELGGGFKLAMSDLQIRGGGNLLGVSQSGHIAAIGYDLYLELLQKTVADLKARSEDPESPAVPDDLDPEVNLRVSAYLPEGYIADVGQRYLIYRRIAGLLGADEAGFQDLRDELAERYGPLPPETENLFAIVEVKRQLLPLRISKLERGPSSLVLSFMADTPIEPGLLADFIQRSNSRHRLTPDGRLVVRTRADTISELRRDIQTITAELAACCNEHLTV